MADPFDQDIPMSGPDEEENIPLATSSSNLPLDPPPRSGMTTINPAAIFGQQAVLLGQTMGNGIFSQSNSVFATSSGSQQQQAQQEHPQQPQNPDDPDISNETSSPNTFGFHQTIPLHLMPKSRNTGYVYDVRMMLHAPRGYRVDAEDNFVDDGYDDLDPEGEHRRSHPEEPRRIAKIFERLKKKSLVQRMVELPCTEVEPREVMLIHSERVWTEVQKTFFMTDASIISEYNRYEKDSLYVNNSTAIAARLSCGGVISATKAVVTGVVRNAIAIVRPPGHHAEPDQSMGFSFFNNVAVATRVVMREEGVKKVLILDWDVHHGNGTQRAFFDDPNVLYISIHRHDGGRFYPCSDFGALDVTGSGAGEGTSVNIPWPKKGFGDGDYMFAFQHIVMPIAYEFAPELVIISAGFDAADGDELGQCKVTPAAYAHMTHQLMALSEGKVVVALEGGYNLDAISHSAETVCRTLLGDELPMLPPLVASDIGTEVIYQVAKIQSRYWKNVNVAACMPLDYVEKAEEDVVDVRDVLKLYRQQFMFEEYKLMPVPMAKEELERDFAGQVMVDSDIWECKTIVLFVHDLGNLQVEHASNLDVETDLVKSRLLDSSRRIMRWIKDKGYSVIDVNTSRAFPTRRDQLLSSGQNTIIKNAPPAYRALMTHVWDNIIDLTSCENIIFLGYGTGCVPIMSLVNARDVTDRVRAVIQVGGMHSLVKPDPTDDEKTEWFRHHSKLYLPANHPVLDEAKVARRLKTQIELFDNTQPYAMLHKAMPSIVDYVEASLPRPADNPIRSLLSQLPR